MVSKSLVEDQNESFGKVGQEKQAKWVRYNCQEKKNEGTKAFEDAIFFTICWMKT